MRIINLADPDCEPSGQELQDLSHRAFEDVTARSAAALKKLEDASEVRRREVLAHVNTVLASATREPGAK
jgi:hypothetical protein